MARENHHSIYGQKRTEVSAYIIAVNDMGAADGLPYAFSLPHSGGRVDLFGNVVFARCDEYGDTIGLTDSDIKALEAKLHAA